MLRFHLDESVSSAIASGLRRRGIEVTTATDTELRHASDEEHLAFAFRERRVLVTHDADFLVLAAKGIPHAGIAYCHLKSRSIGQIIRALETMSTLLSPDQIANQVQFI
jgi:predicted nuclease of predicted toxin-antitoxin system